MEIKKFKDFVSEGIRLINGKYEFDWIKDLPGDLMSLKFSKKKSRRLKFQDTQTTYSYYYGYHLDKSTGSSDLVRAIKLLEDSIDPKDIRTFVNKAVMGFDFKYGIENYSAIVSPESSSLILTELVNQIRDKSGATNLFSNAFVKAASTEIQLDFEKLETIRPDVKKEVLRIYRKVLKSGKTFKIKEVYVKLRYLFKDFILFNTEKDRRLYNAVEGKTVILVDDFRTSGTTTREMISQLSDVGVKHIIVFILIKVGE